MTAPLFGTDVDVVIWPENASDIDPLRFPDATKVVSGSVSGDECSARGGDHHPGWGGTFNSMLLWEYDVSQRAGYRSGSIRQNPSCTLRGIFPWRDFFYPLAPRLFSMVPRDYSFGERDTVFEVDGATAGIAICFDIVDDEILWSMMDSARTSFLPPPTMPTLVAPTRVFSSSLLPG